MIEEIPDEMQGSPELLLIPVERAAKMLSISRTMVYELIRVEGLPVHRFHSSVRINPGELKIWLKERQKDR